MGPEAPVLIDAYGDVCEIQVRLAGELPTTVAIKLAFAEMVKPY